jgi:hypothetical protein
VVREVFSSQNGVEVMDKHHHKCRSCKHYDLEAVKNKAGAVMGGGRAARCLWQWPEISLPVSITRGNRTTMLPSPSWMEPNDGADCPTWEVRNG